MMSGYVRQEKDSSRYGTKTHATQQLWTQTAHLVIKSIAFGLQKNRGQGQGCLQGR